MRPAQVVIDLDALGHNYRLARKLAGGKALAIIKADAYGHGAITCARALEKEADGFGVACIEEALELRQAGIQAPILLLEGFFHADELPLITQHRLWTVVASTWQVQALAQFSTADCITIWLKLNSGMHRLGLSPAEFRSAHTQLSALSHVDIAVVMSHFSCADEPNNAYTLEQQRLFDHTISGLSADISLCNSAALLAWPQIRGHWGRPGLMLYGANPLYPHNNAHTALLRPVMYLQSKIIAVRELAAGQALGYGARFIAQGPTRIGVVALGYADGYPQFAPNGTPVLIEGSPSQVVGRVSMDMLTVDLSQHPSADVGSSVQLWGNTPTINEIAARSHSSAYELLCGRKRAKTILANEISST